VGLGAGCGLASARARADLPPSLLRPTREDHVPHVAQDGARQPSLKRDERPRPEEHEQGVADVPKHDGKEKRKRDDREQRRVRLPVPRHAVRVHDGLKAGRHLVGGKVRRRRRKREERRERGAGTARRGGAQGGRQRGALPRRHPRLTDQHFAGDVHRELVERGVHRLLRRDARAPRRDAGLDRPQQPAPPRVARVDGRLQLAQAGVDFGGHGGRARRVVGVGVPVCAARFTNLERFRARALAREKDDKHRLRGDVAGRGVGDGADGGVLVEEVAARRPEEQPLKPRPARVGHGARDKAQAAAAGVGGGGGGGEEGGVGAGRGGGGGAPGPDRPAGPAAGVGV